MEDGGSGIVVLREGDTVSAFEDVCPHARWRLSDGEIESFMQLAREIARDATVLLIEHNMQVVMELADRITVMNAGKILAEGTPEQIRANAEVQRAYLGTEA